MSPGHEVPGFRWPTPRKIELRLIPTFQRGHAEAHVQTSGGIAPELGGECAQSAMQVALDGWRGEQRTNDREAQACTHITSGWNMVRAQARFPKKRHRAVR